MINEHYRHELKFYINTYEYDELSRIFVTMLKKDKNIIDNKDYMIRSLYFDDYYNTAYNEKEDGVRVRKKYRVRIYNCTHNSIKLECKHKSDAYIFKEAISLTLEEYKLLLNGDISFLLHKNKPLANEFYIDYKSDILRPKVIVDYEREAFIEDAGTVRITFDKNVRAASRNNDIFDSNISTFNIVPEGIMIMEVKFTEFLPEYIRKLLTKEKFTQIQASKYCMCVDKMMTINL